MNYSPVGRALPGLTELIYHDAREVSKTLASNDHVGSKNRNLSGRIRISRMAPNPKVGRGVTPGT